MQELLPLRRSAQAAGRRAAVDRAFASAIRHRRDYIPGPDMGTHEGNDIGAFAAIAEKIARNTPEMLQQAATAGCMPGLAAIAMAEQRVCEATACRRWGWHGARTDQGA